MSIKARITALVSQNQRVFKHDRTQSVGASETFACPRRVWYAKFQPDEAAGTKNWGILERGNIIENYFAVPKLKELFGEANCLYMGDEQDTIVVGRASATPDGLVINQPRDVFKDDGLDDIESDCFTTEVKSFDPRMNLREEKAIHRGQTIMQMGHIRDTTVHKPMHACLMYINANDLTDIRLFFVRFDKDVYEQGLKRSNKIFNTTKPELLIPEGSFTDQCRHCPFSDICTATDVKALPSSTANYDPSDVDNMRTLAARYDEASERLKEATKAKGEAAEEIKQELLRLGSKGIEDEDFKISYYKLGGREKLDTKALALYLESIGTSLDDFKTDGNPSTVLRVTLR